MQQQNEEDQLPNNANLPPLPQEGAESQKIAAEIAAADPRPHTGATDTAEPNSENTTPIDPLAYAISLGFPPNSYVTTDENGVISVSAAHPDPDPEDPRARAMIEKIDPTRHKRNCGRTGATTEIGRAIAAKNATRHGCCATTLILKDEREEDWLDLLNMWLSQYGNPAEKTVLYTFVMKTSQSEWMRIRAQREYDLCIQIHNDTDVALWAPEEHKRHELAQRYLTAAERRFQREYKMLEHHWKTHCKPAEPPKPKAAKPAPEPRPVAPPLGYYNSATGESLDEQDNYRPPQHGFVPRPITPGVYDDDHPSNWRPKLKEGEKP